jgi:anthranilate phosphoribosyltransferase
LAALGTPALSAMAPIANGQVAFYPTALLHPGLQRLLDVRRVVGLRNPAHSLVKLMHPCAGPQVLVSSYTHPEYALSMGQVLQARQSTAMLIRGTEGEGVADPRRTPKMACLLRGNHWQDIEHQGGALSHLPELPPHDAHSTARYIEAVLNGAQPVPPPIAAQVQQITQLANAL